MKKGWTYKKLGEVCKRITDGSHNPPKGILSSNYLMISSQNVFNDNIKLDDVRYLSEEDFIKENKRTNIKSNDVLLTIVGTIGRCAVVNDNIGNITLQRSVAVLSPTSNINSRFLMYCCIGNNENLNKNAHGVAQRGIYLKQLCNIAIPVPSLEEQLQVVSELDLLSGVIEKHKAQIEELDKLAQSIFYDMFGDPVTNEKGWNKIQLGEKCEVTSFKRVLIEEVVEKGVPFIRGTELTALSKMVKGEIFDFTLFITPEHYERVKAISGVPKIGDLLIPSINADGNIWVLDTEEPRYYKDGRVLWVHVNNEAYTSQALKFIMQIMLKDTYSDMASGATFAELKLFVLRELKVILPPLSLQQEFAAKIEAIEAMKAKVRQSLIESETLFNSRMDYYFN